MKYVNEAIVLDQWFPTCGLQTSEGLLQFTDKKILKQANRIFWKFPLQRLPFLLPVSFTYESSHDSSACYGWWSWMGSILVICIITAHDTVVANCQCSPSDVWELFLVSYLSEVPLTQDSGHCW